MLQDRPPSNVQQPLALGSFRNWLRLLWANGGVDRAFLGRACFVSVVSFLTIPLRTWQRLKHSTLNGNATIQHPPIFVLGHWRSGTTMLHQLLCRDPALGYVSTFQSIAPEWFASGGRMIRKLVAGAIPPTRMMDNVKLTLDDPQEEEFAVAEMSPFSFYHQWSFPRNARDYFEKYVLFRNVTEGVIRRWERTYLSVLRQATWQCGGRRLAVKNPVNTGRIRALLALFPDAKFVHIFRNPYMVFLSTRYFFERVLGYTQLQGTRRDEIEANVLWFYEQMMQRFLAERELIPPENLVDVRFEEFERDPLGGLRRVYEGLGLSGFAAAVPDFRRHLASLVGYRKNQYDLDRDAIRKVERHWAFAIKRWGYDLPWGEVNMLAD